MNIEKIDEPIGMLADFSGGQCRPVRFTWKSRSYDVSTVNGRWIDREGGTLSLHYSVQAAGQTWLLHLNIHDVQWRLDQVVV